jgi:hypothetical protein
MNRPIKIGKLSLALTVATLLGITGAEASPILDITPAGVLTGAKYVDVYGIGLYDVTFKTGTCAQVFGDCSLGAPFVFSSLSTATTAGFALLDQVFVDGTFPNLFDSNPGLTSGCNSPLAKHVCGFFTPPTARTLMGG